MSNERTKTPVTFFSGILCYRFFVRFRLKLCLHELLLNPATPPTRHLDFARAPCCECRAGHFGLGRHFRAHKHAQGWRVLLRLRDVQNLGGLLEDVRVAEVCVTLVGGNVREAARESSGRIPRCRTAPTATPTRGASSEVIPHETCVNARAGSPKSLAKTSGISKIA